MHGNEVFALSKCMPRGLAQRHVVVARRPTGCFQDEGAVDVNLRIIIVMKPQFKIPQLVRWKINFAPEPNVPGLPDRPNDGPGSLAGTESAQTLLPRGCIAIFLRP